MVKREKGRRREEITAVSFFLFFTSCCWQQPRDRSIEKECLRNGLDIGFQQRLACSREIISAVQNARTLNPLLDLYLSPVAASVEYGDLGSRMGLGLAAA